METVPGQIVDERYRLLEPIGEGGMGTVYRAEHVKLRRRVALKLLTAELGMNADLRSRFEREARTLAALNHPNVAHIHSVDQVGDVCFLVLELVPGETLEERLKRGPLPIDEAIEVCIQIAEGLEAAHETGVIHRDLKPANVRITPEGKVKVLDFGLAKPARESQPGSSTDSVLSTEAGRLLGTPTYMAPEQARGKPIDRRVDVWAFGCVLYECLTAQRAFAGETLTDVFAAVIEREPDLARLPAATPRTVRELLRRCLVKDPRRRLRDVGEARLALELARTEGPPAVASVSNRPAPREIAAWTLAAALGGLALLSTRGAGSAARDEPRSAYRFSLPQVAAGAGAASISPDGRRLLCISSDELWLRELDEPAWRRIAGVTDTWSAFWSPDSRQIGFLTGDRLKCVGIDGSPPRVLAAVEPGSVSGAWSPDGTILLRHATLDLETWYALAPGASSLKELRRSQRTMGVSPDGTTPSFLPDGEHYLFTKPIDGVGQLQIGSIRSEETRALTPAGSKGIYAAPGHVIYVRDSVLYAQTFDLEALDVTGPPQPIVHDVQFFASNGNTSFSVSGEGTLTYRRSNALARLQWVDRGGRELGTVLKPDRYAGRPALTPDGKRLAVAISDAGSGTHDLWLVDLERGVPSRLTSWKRSESGPCWSQDGKRLAYNADREGPPNVYEWDFAASVGRVLVPYDRSVQYPTSWAPDGKRLFYSREEQTLDVWVADVEAGTQAPFLESEFTEQHARVSPDGRHLAFSSDESGRLEVYLLALDGGRERQRVSVDGGRQPQWRADGAELYYEERGTAIRSVAIEKDAAGGVRVGAPELLFRLAPESLRAWAVDGGGQRFLLVLVDPAEAVRPDEVVVGWPRLLERAEGAR